MYTRRGKHTKNVERTLSLNCIGFILAFYYKRRYMQRTF